MIRNIYYLIAGILAIIFSITHAWNGQTAVLPDLNSDLISVETKTTFFYVWHIVTVENMIFGIAFLIMAFHKDLSKARVAAWIIVAIMIGRWLVIFASTLLYNAAEISNTFVDSVAILVYSVLIIVGTRVEKKQTQTA